MARIMRLPTAPAAHGDLPPVDATPLLRAARQHDGEQFARAAFAWLAAQVHFDRGIFVTSFAERPAYLDAWFHGFDDSAAMVASFESVKHLDVLTPGLMQQPGKTQRQDADDPRIAGDDCAPLRAHLLRFGVRYSICIGVPMDGDSVTVIVLARSNVDARFVDAELAALDLLAPQVTETLTINRQLALLRSPSIGVAEFPVALVDHAGRFVHVTSAFTRLFWPHRAPPSIVLDNACFAALRRGDTWPLDDGHHCVQAVAEPAGWLLRIVARSRADVLSLRERAIAQLFAGGANYKTIAQQLGVAPATARNHLRNVYQKLGVSHRVALIAALAERASD